MRERYDMRHCHAIIAGYAMLLMSEPLMLQRCAQRDTTITRFADAPRCAKYARHAAKSAERCRCEKDASSRAASRHAPPFCRHCPQIRRCRRAIDDDALILRHAALR